jgi:hypothetical protein
MADRFARVGQRVTAYFGLEQQESEDGEPKPLDANGKKPVDRSMSFALQIAIDAPAILTILHANPFWWVG